MNWPHYIPEDDFEHDETPGSLACICGPTVCSMAWYGCAIVHREMMNIIPDTFPDQWL